MTCIEVDLCGFLSHPIARREMKVDFVRADLGSALTNRREVERLRQVIHVHDFEHGAYALMVTSNQYDASRRNLWAASQSVDRMHICVSGGSAPKHYSCLESTTRAKQLPSICCAERPIDSLIRRLSHYLIHNRRQNGAESRAAAGFYYYRLLIESYCIRTARTQPLRPQP